ncbi:hypothetical protein A374_16458 [Fictibacillus macauensis ZFHKF-1]|uniref:DUF3899 domain-containing protein n=1 Tax=Fictibacillus macauensis ZFHKF-1 TaxID=1196324 RepID=I8UBN8_9BACL|nr:hypothetical protein [Fictibacillus macauensis]EIT84213.1 hypothetical protein A374_16458 [Fictibacillus macauensis ZFHKF-1]
MKKLITSFITLGILVAISYAISFFTDANFIDFTFFVGLCVSSAMWFFNSKGGFSSRSTALSMQSTTGMKVEAEKFTFNPSVAFITSVSFTVLSLVATFIYYRNYFI